MPAKLDRIDLRIISVLQAEARITNLALSERVALSPSACLARVRRLESDGVFTSYRGHVCLDQVRPTAVTILAEVTLRQHHPIAFAQFERLLDAIPQVVEAAQVSGAFDYLLKIVVPDVRSWRALAARLQGDRHGVVKVTSHIVLKESKPFAGLPLE